MANIYGGRIGKNGSIDHAMMGTNLSEATEEDRPIAGCWAGKIQSLLIYLPENKIAIILSSC